jgi:Threonyl-tRNA synthetase
MNKFKLTAILAALALMTAGGVAQAATVQIDWQNPEKFRDVRSTNESAERFRERVMGELTKAFEDGAKRLPADQTLHVAVSDVDLAGEVEYFHDNHPFGLRVLRRVDAPSMKIQYELRDANDRVIQSGEEKLRDLNYNQSSLLPLDRSPFKYEKDMIKSWVRDTFQTQ